MSTTAEKSGSESALNLFETVTDVKAGTKREEEYLDLTEIEMDPENPRTEEDASLTELVKRNGVEKAIIVFPVADAATRTDGIRYRIFDGERRYLASIAAGFTTIPARIERDGAKLTRVQKLLRQAGLNEHEKLPPMDEARLYDELQRETGWTDQEIADATRKPKSTVSDRLALLRAPEPFKPLLFDGTLSASAAPILRRFTEVPLRVLEIAARTAPEDAAWKAAKHAGKSVEVKDVGRVLDKIILDEQMRELPERLVLLYLGPTCKVAGVTYASDIPAFLTAQRAAEKEEQRAGPTSAARAEHEQHESQRRKRDDAKASPAKSGSGKEVTKTTPMNAAGEPQLSRAERKRIDEEEAAAKEAERSKAAWRAATPKILDAVAGALKKAGINGGPKDPIANALLELFAKSDGIDEATADRLVGRGTTPVAFIRFLTMALLVVDIEDEYQHEALPRRLKGLGLNVDVLKLVAAARKEIEKGAPKAVEPKTNEPVRRVLPMKKKVAAKPAAKKKAKK